MGIFGKKIEKKYGETEANAAEVEKAKEKVTSTRKQLLDERRGVFKEVIAELKSDITELVVDEGIDEDTARVYLILKKYEKPVIKLIDSYYNELYLEIKKAEELEEALVALSQHAKAQNELIERQTKALETIAKTLEKKEK